MALNEILDSTINFTLNVGFGMFKAATYPLELYHRLNQPSCPYYGDNCSGSCCEDKYKKN